MDAYIGQIMMFAGNFEPQGWAFCDGRLLSIQQYSAVFAILGTTYGGDGRTNFALPDLRGRVPIHAGAGPGLSPYTLGHQAGSESASLPAHTHTLPNHSHAFAAPASAGRPGTKNPNGAAPATTSADAYASASDGSKMLSGTTGDGGAGTTGSAGSGGPAVSTIQPSLAINFIICLQGLFPTRG
jgi:microcystin-dependent protein